MKIKEIASATAAAVMAVSMISGTCITASAAVYNTKFYGLTVNLKDLEGKAVDVKNLALVDADGYVVGNFKKISKGYMTVTSTRGFDKGTQYWIMDTSKKCTNGYMPLMVGYEMAKNKPEYSASLDLKVLKSGDVNYDGKIDFQDLGLLQRAITEQNTYNLTYELPDWLPDNLSYNSITLFDSMTDKKIVGLNYMDKIPEATLRKYREAAKAYTSSSDEKWVNYTVWCNYFSGCTANQKSPADINADGKVDTQDTALLQKYLAGWNVKLGE